MMGLSHVMSGTAVGAALCLVPPFRYLDPGSQAAIVSTCGGFALVPDMDHQNSSISRVWGPVSGGVRARVWGRRRRILPGITDVVCWISGGHRKGTHTVEGTALFLFLVWVASWSRIGTALVLGMIAGFAYAGLVMLLRWSIRKHAAENVVLSAGLAVVSYQQGWSLPWWLVVSVALGILVHIAGDMLTTGKCPLSWWNTKRKVGLGLFDTNGPFERWIMRPLLVVANAVPLLYLAGFHPIGAAYAALTT